MRRVGEGTKTCSARVEDVVEDKARRKRWLKLLNMPSRDGSLGSSDSIPATVIDG